MEEAIHDGVDVINLSLGSQANVTFDKHPIAIAAFKAMARGVLVVSAAGNSGPAHGTLSATTRRGC
jgi:subtilisin family serine protease